MKSATWLRAIDGVVRIAVAVVATLIALMMLNLIIDSASRNLLQSPLPGTTDIVSFLWMPGLAILGLGYAQIRDEQVRVTIVSEKTSPSTRRKLEIATEIVSGITSLVLTIVAAQVFLDSLEIGKTATSSRWLQLWPGQFLITIGFAICALAAVARIYRLSVGTELPAAVPEELRSTVVD